MSGRWGFRYSQVEIVHIAAANTLASRERARALKEIAELHGRPRYALRVMADRMKKPDAVLLERCRAAQADDLPKTAMVPVRKYSPRVKATRNQPVARASTSGCGLTEVPNQE